MPGTPLEQIMEQTAEDQFDGRLRRRERVMEEDLEELVENI